MASSLSAAAALLRCLAGPGASCWNTNDRQTDSSSSPCPQPQHSPAHRRCVRPCACAGVCESVSERKGAHMCEVHMHVDLERAK